METLFLMTLKKYFPEFTVKVNSIHEKVYIKVDDLIECVITIFRGNANIDDLIVKEDSFYHDKEKGKQMDALYTIHSIVCTIISNKDQFEVETISSENQLLKEYMRRAYRAYVYDDKIIIKDLLIAQSNKFNYLEVEEYISKSSTRIGLNVSYYPIQTILSNYMKFAVMGTVIPFEPCLQNSRVLLRCADIVPSTLYNGVLLEVIIKGNVSRDECVSVIDNHFTSLQQYMVSCIPMFNNFDSYLVDIYNLTGRGWFEEIASMSGIPLYFLDEYKEQLKPYAVQIIKDEYCQLEYIVSNRRLVSKNKLWAHVLVNNKNMTREFLLRFIKKYPNALIYRLEILESGDEELFKKYKRHINWTEFVKNFNGTRLCIAQILRVCKKYISPADVFHLITTQREYAKNEEVLSE